eukprot:g2018.t1
MEISYSLQSNNCSQSHFPIRHSLKSCNSVFTTTITRRRPQRLLERRFTVEHQDCEIAPRQTEHLEIARLLNQSLDEEDEDWQPSGRSPCISMTDEPVGCPVFVMLPLDTVWVIDKKQDSISVLKKPKALELALHTFRRSGVEGVMIDIWWGICERTTPKEYDFSAYNELFQLVSCAGLKIQAVMSFHAAGSNVGDTCKIPLPEWVLGIGDQNPDIFYTDKQGFRNRECLSLGCDCKRVLHERTPVEIYKDFTSEFTNNFRDLLGTVITEITVGLGPAGELRYPSYPEGDGRWRFPGVGEFQCYDKYMLGALRAAAEEIGRPEWGHCGPYDAGHYNSRSWETEFFNHWGTFQSDYGQFFLTWYSDLLVQHAERILQAIAQVVYQPGLQKTTSLVSTPYHGCSISHAAELTAGYYNSQSNNGYEKIIQCLKQFNVHLSFTCVEMRDCDHPPEAACSPQGLLDQIINCCEHHGVKLAGENALQRYDDFALSRITETAFGKNSRAGVLDQITFLRMADTMFDNWEVFQCFLDRMRNPR